MNPVGGKPSSNRRDERKVSKEELALFLRRFALIYENPRTGNPALSEALLELADSLLGPSRSTEDSRSADGKGHYPRRQNYSPRLQKLDAASVAEFLSDETKTKPELIELAAARFSIPRARLMKMRTSDVRDAIRAALLHEDSLTIITEQAQRSGANRNS
jgi:hypothetical protein